MTGITQRASLIVVAALAMLFAVSAAPVPAHSPNDESLVPKGRHRVANPEGQVRRATKNNSAKRVVNKHKKTQGSSQGTGSRRVYSTGSGRSADRHHVTSTGSGKGTAESISSRSTARDLSKIKSLSIANETKGKPISIANQSKEKAISLGKQTKEKPVSLANQAPAPSSIGGKPVSAISGKPVSTLGVGSGTAVSGLLGAGILKHRGGIKTAPGKEGTTKPPGDTTNPQGGTTNTQGGVTGGGKGSVTTGGVQSGGGAGSNTQGGTVSTGGGNTVGGVQQSGNNDTVNVNQTNTTNNTTNITKVSGGGGGFGGGGGVVAEEPSVDVAPVDEPEPEVVSRPVFVTRAAPAAPSDSCPTVVELNQLGVGYYQTGTYSSAEDAFNRALELLDKQACKNIPLKATTLENLAFIYDKLGKPNDGAKYREQAKLLRRMK